jgi:hypothetical protein
VSGLFPTVPPGPPVPNRGSRDYQVLGKIFVIPAIVLLFSQLDKSVVNTPAVLFFYL